jgi:hypothetical protein
MEYEPIFGNLSKLTDYLGHETRFFTDYQEGENLEGQPNDVITQLQAELLDIYDRQQVVGFLSGTSITLENHVGVTKVMPL